MITRFGVWLTALGITSVGLAQGSLNFANVAAGVNSPVYNSIGDLCEGTAYWAQLWAEVDSSLTAVGDPVNFRQDDYPGYFLGGVRDIPGVTPGFAAQVQVRVWSANYSSWETVWDAFNRGDTSAEIGWSFCNDAMDNLDVTFPAVTGGWDMPPWNLIGLPSFQLRVGIPEPSTSALAIIGGLTLLLGRRHRARDRG